MSSRDRSSAGTSRKSDGHGIKAGILQSDGHGLKVGIIFGARPPKSQVAEYSDAVSHRIAKLDEHAQGLGEGFGIPFTTFVLNPVAEPAPNEGAALIASMLRALATRETRVSLERRNARWGLYFVRAAAALGQDRGTEAVPLKDAPLDVRERFLERSGEFFRQYLELCGDRLGRMKQAVEAADRTLAHLEELTASA